ncbi:hypothetical protein GCM10010277_15440 [Streptomyces longisporoflavus]|uniref:DNA cytosine methyltransferase n=1 Tax=Streptomyces longisporoflavus TaxID=28044 RepID=UPI0019BC653B|nr:DUF6339 family protein [Streptomyces longisporoflavus]GGV31622.1 hypothetical protein GCM10010277_15440 [Streptomyces longisporoflavus]
MALLYPRLLAGQAKPLHQQYKEMPLPDLAELVAYRHESAVYVATGGDRITESQLRDLRALVLETAKRAGFPEESSRAARARFDLDLAALLHGKMDLMPAEAASGDVWAFLALILLPDVAYWRYPRPPGDRVVASDLTRHVFGRLWWRAHLVRDSAALEPYAALDILGEAAFDQIYARRKALGGSPHLVRNILHAWAAVDLHGLPERDVLRDFLKRLLRLAPFVIFEALADADLRAELSAVVDESVAALRTDESQPASAETVPTSATSAEQTGRPEPEPISASQPASPTRRLTSLELCAGAGGLALGLEYAGFDPALLIDHRPVALDTLRLNRPGWRLREEDLSTLDPQSLAREQPLLRLDLISGGLPRVKAAAAVSRERGNDHELAVLRATLDLTRILRPRALLIENVPDLITSETYAPLRDHIQQELAASGYTPLWFVLNAAHYGVPQFRKQGILLAFASAEAANAFRIPPRSPEPAATVGQALGPSMAARGWAGVAEWMALATEVAPTLVGGSWDRGGADLGPTGSKRAWARMGVDGGTVANEVPDPDFVWNPTRGRDGMMALTVEQAALLQGFPKDWVFAGRKTARYRQVGHASPPPVGEALGRAIYAALSTA